MKKTNAIRLLDLLELPFELLEYSYSGQDLSVDKIAADNELNVEKLYKTLVLEKEG